MSWAAVLTPMPGTPGTLSVESPASAWTSTTLSGVDAELLHHLPRARSCVFLIGSSISTPGRIELHQVLVGRHDGAGGAGLDGQAGIGGDQVVGLVAVELDAP